MTYRVGRGDSCACPVESDPAGPLGRQSHIESDNTSDSGPAGSAVVWVADDWRVDILALKVDGLAHRAKVVIEEFDLVDRLWNEDRFKSAEGYVAARAALHRLVAWMRESDRKTVIGGYAAARDREGPQEAEMNKATVASLSRVKGGRH